MGLTVRLVALQVAAVVTAAAAALALFAFATLAVTMTSCTVGIRPSEAWLCTDGRVVGDLLGAITRWVVPALTLAGGAVAAARRSPAPWIAGMALALVSVPAVLAVYDARVWAWG